MGLRATISNPFEVKGTTVVTVKVEMEVLPDGATAALAGMLAAVGVEHMV